MEPEIIAINDLRIACVDTQNGFPGEAGNTSAYLGRRFAQRPIKSVPTSLPMEVTTSHLLAEEATEEFNVQQSASSELMASIACVDPKRVIPILDSLVDEYINDLDTMVTKIIEVVRNEELGMMCHLLIHHPLCLRWDKIFAAFDKNGGSQFIDNAFIEHYKLKTLTEDCSLTTIQIPIFERYIDHILQCRWIGDSLLCSYIASRNSTAITWFTKHGFYAKLVDIAGGTWDVDFRGDSVYVPGGDRQHYEIALERAEKELQKEFNAEVDDIHTAQEEKSVLFERMDKPIVKMSDIDFVTNVYNARRADLQSKIAIVSAKLLALDETESERRKDYQSELDKLEALKTQGEAMYRDLLSGHARKQ